MVDLYILYWCWSRFPSTITRVINSICLHTTFIYQPVFFTQSVVLNCSLSPFVANSVISGVGELNLDRDNQKTKPVFSPDPADRPYPDCPYLLLDVRDRDQYDCCHIISGRWKNMELSHRASNTENFYSFSSLSPAAHSFPIAMLSRTMNPYTKEVLEYVSFKTKYTARVPVLLFQTLFSQNND